MECEFCKKTFSSKSNLYTHQHTAKFCLELQGNGSNKEFKCEFCNKQYAQKKGLILHINSCKEREKMVRRHAWFPMTDKATSVGRPTSVMFDIK